MFTGILSAINKNISDKKEYANYKAEVEKWINNANAVIDECNSIQNLERMYSNLSEINVSTYD